MVHSDRKRVMLEWNEMLASGIIPIIEEETEHGKLIVELSLDDFGMGFIYYFIETSDYDNFKPYFDGEILKRHGIYYVSNVNIDRSCYTLDAVLQLIYDNIMEGVVYAIGK